MDEPSRCERRWCARWCVGLALASLLACGGDGEEELRERTTRGPGVASSESSPAGEPDESEAAAEPEEPTGRAAAEVAGADAPAEAAPIEPTAEVEPAEPQGPLDRAALAAKVLDDTVSDALAAAHAAEVGASLCDAAYESAAELVRVVRERFPDEVRDMPPRELFVDHCQTLPEPAQQCLVVRYAVAHQDECRRVQDALPDAQRRRMEELLAGR